MGKGTEALAAEVAGEILAAVVAVATVAAAVVPVTATAEVAVDRTWMRRSLALTWRVGKTAATVM